MQDAPFWTLLPAASLQPDKLGNLPFGWRFWLHARTQQAHDFVALRQDKLQSALYLQVPSVAASPHPAVEEFGGLAGSVGPQEVCKVVGAIAYSRIVNPCDLRISAYQT